mgnify:CR=1 FL=1
MTLDTIDISIIELLRNNSKLSTKEISKQVRMPITTVHNRIKKLEKEGIIKKYTVILDNKKLGKLISAYVLLNMDYQKIKEHKYSQSALADRLKNNPSVELVNVITGRKDMILKVLAKDLEELNDIIANVLQTIPEIKQTETFIVLY